MGRHAILSEEPAHNCIIQNAFHRVPREQTGEKSGSSVRTGNGRTCGVVYRSEPAVRSHLTGDKLAALRIPLPPINEQRAIANFLDREIAGVDELAQCKRSLLTKLEEERVAVVARAVTKGLPAHAASAAGFTPNPRLKQTDVDWLGEVPDHWEISQLKWVVHFQRGHDLPSESREQGQVPSCHPLA